MQIRRAKPDAIERQVCVAKSFSEMAEPPWVPGVQRVLRYREFFSIGIQPMSVGADFVNRHYVSHVLASEISSIATVTICTVLDVKLFALGTELRVDPEWILRRFLCQQPLLDTRQLFQIDRGRKCAGAERGALVPLLHEAVVAVPMSMKVFRFAQALQPDRRKITKTNQLASFQFFERKFQKRLGRIECVGAAGAGVRLPVRKTEMPFQHKQPFAHKGDRIKAEQETIDEIVVAANRLDLSHH